MISLEANKVIGAILVAGIAFQLCGLVGELLVHSETPPEHAIFIASLEPGASAPTIAPPSSPLDAVLKRLILGNIAFSAPDHARLGKSQIIEVKLAVNIPRDALLAQLTGAGKKEAASISVADRMSATLSGGGAFDVSPSGPQQQLISLQQVTSWTWEITPKQAGPQYLVLSIDAVLTVAGKDGTRNFRTFTKTITVDIGWPESASEWFEFLRTWGDNISWLWLTILVPAGLWIWRRLAGKKPRVAARVQAIKNPAKNSSRARPTRNRISAR